MESVSLSGDGRLALTGSSDKTAIIWEARTGAKLQTFVGHEFGITSVALSRDGRVAMTGSWDKTAILWDVQTGAALRKFTGHSEAIRSVGLSGDGSRAVTSSSGEAAIVWNTRTGVALRTFPMGKGEGLCAAISGDGARLVANTDNSTATLWDVGSGAKLQTFAGHDSHIASVALSANGRHAVTGSQDSKAILWDAANGTKLQTFTGHMSSVFCAALSDDGRYLLTGSTDKTAILWNAKSGAKLHAFAGHTDYVLGVALSGDGSRVLTGSPDGKGIVWDGVSGIELRALSGLTSEVRRVFLSDNADRILTASKDKTATLFDSKAGTKLRTLVGHERSPYTTWVALSGDSRRTITSSADSKSAIVWDAESGAQLRVVGMEVDLVSKVALSGDGHRALAANYKPDGSVVVWDTATGKQLRSWQAEWVNDVAVNGDGRRAVTGSLDKTAVLWDAENGRRLQTFAGHTRNVRSVALSKDERRAVSGSEDGTAILWDVASGTKLHTFDGHTFWVMAVAISGDGRRVITGSMDRTAIVWDANTGAKIHSLVGHTNSVVGVAITRDGKRALTCAGDGTTRVWDTETGKDLCSIITVDAGKDWLVTTPEGLFDGSVNAAKLISYRISGTLEFVPLERYQQKYYQPGLLAAIMKGERPMPKVNIHKSLPPVVRFVSPKAGEELKANTLKVKVEAESRSGTPIQALRLLVDGRPYKGQHEVQKLHLQPAMSAAVNWDIELEPGKHTLKVLADTEYVQGASDEIEVKYIGGGVDPGKVEIPKLYVLAIGVSNYPGVRKLDYAAKDAEELVAAFRSKSRGLYQDVEVKLITNEKATQDEIFAGLLWLREKMTGKSTGVVFFGGHAEVDKVDNSLYLLPVNFQEKNLAGTAIDAERFRKQLMAIPGRLILMLDACHAGAIDGGDGKKRGPGQLTDLLVRDLTAEENGLIVMCSALGHEQSQESNEFRHGLFTWAVLEALRDGKSEKTDGAVYLSALDSYVAKRVKELSKGRQNPVTGKPTSVRDFPISKP